MIETDALGSCLAGARGAISAAAAVAAARKGPCGVLALVPSQADDAARAAAGQILASAPGARAAIVAWAELADRSHVSRGRLLELVLAGFGGPAFFAAELRAPALAAGEGRSLADDRMELVDGVDAVSLENGSLSLSGLRFDRKVRFHAAWGLVDAGCQVICAADLAAPTPAASPLSEGRAILLDDVPIPAGADVLAHAFRSASAEIGSSLASAEFIIDVGYGVGSRDGIEEVVDPLKAALQRLGVRSVTIGATRKVTQDLGILPDSLQIGQTGTAVNPRVLLALGVSGAPQHLEYIGPRAVIFAFNKDPEAPLMVLNRSRPRPRVFPVPGDLFSEVPRFVRALESHLRAESRPVEV